MLLLLIPAFPIKIVSLYWKQPQVEPDQAAGLSSTLLFMFHFSSIFLAAKEEKNFYSNQYFKQSNLSEHKVLLYKISNIFYPNTRKKWPTLENSLLTSSFKAVHETYINK